MKPNRDTIITKLREERRGVRIRHSFYGMVTAWFTGVCVLAVFNFRYPERMMELLVAWMGVTGLVCLVAWLLLALPVYWVWPRHGRWWSVCKVGLMGFAMGSLPGWLFAFHQGLVPEVLIVMLIPGGYGLVTALVARWLEEGRLGQKVDELAVELKPV